MENNIKLTSPDNMFDISLEINTMRVYFPFHVVVVFENSKEPGIYTIECIWALLKQSESAGFSTLIWYTDSVEDLKVCTK